MNRRTPIRVPIRALAAAALALLLALGAALSAALPAVAAPPPPGPDLPPELTAAMERDLGLSPAQARERVAAEEAAAHTAEQLQDRLGASFGGAWFDPAQGGLVVGTTDPAAVAVVTAAGAQARVVPHGEAELAAVQSELDAVAAAVPDAVTGWHVDPVTSAVVVTATDAAAAEAFVARAGAAGDPVRVEVVAERPRLFADLVGGAAINRSGGGRCSIGFSVRSSRATYVLTAGHCTEGGGSWAGSTGATIGPVALTRFPSDDFGFIRVDSSAWTASSRVAGTTSVLGATVAPLGSSICRSGSTTGYRCGVVQSFDQTVNYGGGDVVYQLTGTNACAEPGDSGGSFVSGRQAQGMTSGGSGNCTVGGETFFQPVGEALRDYGLTLVTG